MVKYWWLYCVFFVVRFFRVLFIKMKKYIYIWISKYVNNVYYEIYNNILLININVSIL